MRKIGFLWAVFMAAGVSANPLDKAMRLVPEEQAKNIDRLEVAIMPFRAAPR